jgi:hypothetical protein
VPVWRWSIWPCCAAGDRKHHQDRWHQGKD